MKKIVRVLPLFAMAQYVPPSPIPVTVPTSAIGLKTVNGPLGEYLTDSSGMSLYVFDSDNLLQSQCTGACAQTWPPLIVSSGEIVTATGFVQSSLIGSTQRQDGSKQITYAGRPLYRYILDQTVGSTLGEGISSFGANWYLMKPDGTKLLPPPAPAPSLVVPTPTFSPISPIIIPTTGPSASYGFYFH